MSGAVDATGLFPLRHHSHVKVVRRNHRHYLKTGTVIRLDENYVWIAMPGGAIVRAGHRSVEVVMNEASRKARGGR